MSVLVASNPTRLCGQCQIPLEPSKKRRRLGRLILFLPLVLINLAVVHYADKKHAVQDILALLLPAPATPQDPTPVPKQAEQPKQAAAPAPKQSATKRAEAPPPPKKKEPPQNDPAPTKCIPIDYVVEDIRDRDGEAAEWHFDRMYTRHYVCLSLPLTSLSDGRATFVDKDWFPLRRQRPTIYVDLAPGQDLSGVVPGDRRRIVARPAKFTRKQIGPFGQTDEMFFKDGQFIAEETASATIDPRGRNNRIAPK